MIYLRIRLSNITRIDTFKYNDKIHFIKKISVKNWNHALLPTWCVACHIKQRIRLSLERFNVKTQNDDRHAVTRVKIVRRAPFVRAGFHPTFSIRVKNAVVWHGLRSSICQRYLVERLRNAGTVCRCRGSDRMLRGSCRKSKVNSLLFVADRNTCAIIRITKMRCSLPRRVEKQTNEFDEGQNGRPYAPESSQGKPRGYSAELFINKSLRTDIHFSSNPYVFHFVTQRPRLFCSFISRTKLPWSHRKIWRNFQTSRRTPTNFVVDFIGTNYTSTDIDSMSVLPACRRTPYVLVTQVPAIIPLYSYVRL